jgi:Fungal Zn(2)-Cys(6) binuclear cluster domain
MGENAPEHSSAKILGKRKPPPRSTNGAKARRRAIVACDICRSRRTKCDGQRPSCHYCESHHTECTYQDPLPPPASNLELQLAAMNGRLDHITSLLSRGQTYYTADNQDQASYAGDHFSHQQASPFKLLWSPSIMRVFGLESGFADSIVGLERSLYAPAAISIHSVPLVHYQDAVRALASFSEKIHIWYPILPLGFSEQFFRTLSSPLTPSSQSCLALLVVAIGTLVENKGSLDSQSGQVYFDAALISLPIIISEHSLCSAQCLFLLGIYYCCLLQPCQAHDYSLMASNKVLKLLKR